MKQPSTMSGLKRLIPVGIKKAARRAYCDRMLRRAIRDVASLPQDQVPSREVLTALQVGWDNEGFAARTDYLEEVVRRAASTSGPVLECGSGLTTLLLGMFAGRRGVETWSLEHVPEWASRIRATLERFAIAGINMPSSPLRAYDGFSWYDPPADSLPKHFSLVICDGPPGSTPGGRYGLLPVLGDRLGRDTVIMLDDADRGGEAEVLKRWTNEGPWEASMRETPTGAFALISQK